LRDGLRRKEENCRHRGIAQIGAKVRKGVAVSSALRFLVELEIATAEGGGAT
jgi:hypothetical protein